MRLLVALLAIGLSGCALPDFDYDGDGRSVADGDCDDFDPTIHDQAEELVGDHIDQDCDDADTVERVVGEEHSCDLDDHRRISCDAPGGVSYDQLNVPEPRSGTAFVAIAAGDFHTCALGKSPGDEDGYVTCWGDDTFGQLSPPINGIFVSIEAFGNVSLGGRADRPAICWGDCVSPQQNP